MNIPILPHNKFLQFGEVFHKTVQKSPITVTLVVSEKQNTAGAFAAFTGDSLRIEKEYTLKCLYRRDFSSWDRQKYGLHAEISGVIYVSPQDLVKHFGTFNIDHRNLKILMHGFYYQADKIITRSPYYGGCFAVEIRLKDLDRAGE